MTDEATLDLLLCRILDRRAAPADWDAFAALAQSQPDAWRHLLAALRSEQGLQRGAEADLALADRVELPVTGDVAPLTAPEVAPLVSLSTARERRGWRGWAAAAVLALAWAGSSLMIEDTAPGALPGAPSGAQPVAQETQLAEHPAELPATQPAKSSLDQLASGPRLRDPADAPLSADEASHGDVFGQLPLQLVSSAAAPDGNGLDVVYVRPLLERARVSGMYSLGLDDAGRPAPVNIQPASLLMAGN